MATLLATVVWTLLAVGAGAAIWVNGSLVAERDAWKREALASHGERIGVEQRLERCLTRKGGK